jgi:hypothetical protein
VRPRLRLCACGRLLVALNVRAEYCGRECSNRLKQKAFYDRHTEEQRKIKLARYHVNRLKHAAAAKKYGTTRLLAAK